MSTVGQDLYDGSAKLGVFQGKLKLIIGIVIGVLLICSASGLFASDQSNLVDTHGSIVSAECQAHQEKNSVKYNCNVKVKYNVNNTEYNNSISTNGSTKYVDGNQIELTYDTKNPNSVSEYVIRNKWWALLLLVIALIIIGCSWLNNYLTQNYKMYAAAQGASTVASIVSSPFKTNN
jgi:hypothetical protein